MCVRVPACVCVCVCVSSFVCLCADVLSIKQFRAVDWLLESSDLAESRGERLVREQYFSGGQFSHVGDR